MVTPGTPPIPHVGGPVLPAGCPTVLIGGMPAARVGDMATCVGPPDTIIPPCAVTVLIGGMPAARVGDMTMHGGTIMVGCPTVLIGNGGAGGGGGGGAGEGVGGGGGDFNLAQSFGSAMITTAIQEGAKALIEKGVEDMMTKVAAEAALVNDDILAAGLASSAEETAKGTADSVSDVLGPVVAVGAEVATRKLDHKPLWDTNAKEKYVTAVIKSGISDAVFAVITGPTLGIGAPVGIAASVATSVGLDWCQSKIEKVIHWKEY